MKTPCYLFALIVLCCYSCQERKDATEPNYYIQLADTIAIDTTLQGLHFSLKSIYTKVDENGVEQCGNYAQTTENDAVFHAYGYTPKQLLANLLEVNAKYVRTRFIHDYSLDYTVNKQDTAYRKQALNTLLLCLGLQLDTQVISKDAYELVVQNETYLKPLQQNDSSVLSLSQHSIFCKNQPLNSLVYFLNDAFETPIITDYHHPEKAITVELNTKSIERANKALAQQGMVLQPIKADIAYFTFSHLPK